MRLDKYKIRRVEIMKKLLITLILVAILIPGIAVASLIGVKSMLGYPDISYNNTGTIHYTASTGEFLLTATDLQLTMSVSGPSYSLLNTATPPFYSVNMVADLYLNNGNLIRGTMTEAVSSLGPLPLLGNLIPPGTVLVTADVTDFGWGTGSELGQFDAIGQVTG
jgi:hypothetical protein